MSNEKIKLNNEELAKLKNIIDTETSIYTRLGQIEKQLEIASKQKNDLLSELDSYNKMKDNLQQVLKNTYGNITGIDIESGELSITK